MKKIWQTHILQDTKLKRKKIKKKSALTILFQTIANKVELNLKFNLLQHSKINEAYFPYLGCQKNQITEKCFPSNKRHTSFSPITLTSDFQNFSLLRGMSTSLLIIN